MLRRLLSLLITVVKLPLKIVLLPFKLLSTLFSLMFYVSVLLTIGAVVYFVVL